VRPRPGRSRARVTARRSPTLTGRGSARLRLLRRPAAGGRRVVGPPEFAGDRFVDASNARGWRAVAGVVAPGRRRARKRSAHTTPSTHVAPPVLPARLVDPSARATPAFVRCALAALHDRSRRGQSMATCSARHRSQRPRQAGLRPRRHEEHPHLRAVHRRYRPHVATDAPTRDGGRQRGPRVARAYNDRRSLCAGADNARHPRRPRGRRRCGRFHSDTTPRRSVLQALRDERLLADDSGPCGPCSPRRVHA
jgi:hypothetical protein